MGWNTSVTDRLVRMEFDAGAADVSAVRRSYRGNVLTAVLITLSIIGTFGVAAMVIVPRGLSASNQALQTILPASAEHGKITDALTSLIGRSVMVLAVHQRGPTPLLEIVLWMEDPDDAGLINRSEVAVLTHSRIMQTITFYRWAKEEVKDEADQLHPAVFRDPAFCQQWRTNQWVDGQVIARQLSDLSIEQFDSITAGSQRLRISLSWSGESADGADNASVWVDAAIGIERGKE